MKKSTHTRHIYTNALSTHVRLLYPAHRLRMNTLAKTVILGLALVAGASAEFQPCDDNSSPKCPNGLALKTDSFPPCEDGKPVCADGTEARPPPPPENGPHHDHDGSGSWSGSGSRHGPPHDHDGSGSWSGSGSHHGPNHGHDGSGSWSSSESHQGPGYEHDHNDQNNGHEGRDHGGFGVMAVVSGASFLAGILMTCLVNRCRRRRNTVSGTPIIVEDGAPVTLPTVTSSKFAILPSGAVVVTQASDVIDKV